MKEYITISDLYEAYFDCRKHKRRKNSSIAFEVEYEQNIQILYEELNSMEYDVGKSIAFCVTRPKLREVFAAEFRDRVVHHLVINKFGELFDKNMIFDSYSCRKNKGVQFGVERVDMFMRCVSCNYTKQAYILKCDIQGFFMGINKDILYNEVERIICSGYNDSDRGWWLWLIHKIIYNRPELNCEIHGDVKLWNDLPPNKTLFKTNGVGLPIGNLTSQIFANVYLSIFDRWVLSNINGGRYGRYVDDFVILHDDKEFLLSMIQKIKMFLNIELKLTLHPRKIYFQSVYKGVRFIGTIIHPNRRHTQNRTIESFYHVVELYNRSEIKKIDFIQRYNSYSGFLVHNMTYYARRKAWDKIDNKRRLIVVGHFHHIKLKKYDKNYYGVKRLRRGKTVRK